LRDELEDKFSSDPSLISNPNANGHFLNSTSSHKTSPVFQAITAAPETSQASYDQSVWRVQDRIRTFEEISDKGTWGKPEGSPDGDQDTVSGGGSFISVTEEARACITSWIQKYNIRSLLDAPCGDALWQGLISGIEGKYTGADISTPSLVRAIARKRNQNAKMRFRWMDVVSENIDGREYDAVMYRDFIQHLSVRHGVRAIENAKAGGVKYLIASTFPFVTQNIAQDQLAPSYKNNLRIAPFNLPESLEDCNNHVLESPSDGSRLQLFQLNP
jgi:hypothetical protein